MAAMRTTLSSSAISNSDDQHLGQLGNLSGVTALVSGVPSTTCAVPSVG